MFMQQFKYMIGIIGMILTCLLFACGGVDGDQTVDTEVIEENGVATNEQLLVGEATIPANPAECTLNICNPWIWNQSPVLARYLNIRTDSMYQPGNILGPTNNFCGGVRNSNPFSLYRYVSYPDNSWQRRSIYQAVTANTRLEIEVLEGPVEVAFFTQNGSFVGSTVVLQSGAREPMTVPAGAASLSIISLITSNSILPPSGYYNRFIRVYVVCS
jgi:hypothetical protein